jgi:hypothetical protein
MRGCAAAGIEHGDLLPVLERLVDYILERAQLGIDTDWSATSPTVRTIIPVARCGATTA